MALVFDWLNTKQIKTKEYSPLSTKTKQITLLFEWLKTKQIKTKVCFAYCEPGL